MAMHSFIYDKTDKGREEIATRKYQVPAKLRTLLVLIDGRHTLEWLLKNVAGLGLNEANVDQLLQQEYITLVSGGEAANEAEIGDTTAGPKPPASARARMLARQAAAREALATVEDEPDELPEDPPDESGKIRALHDFYNQSIKATLGLRGVALQLKVEKAADVGAYEALRLPYLQAVLKAKGAAAAIEMRERLDALLGGAPEPDEFILPDPNAAPKGLFDYFNLSSDSVNF
jgi:hypothetical protein